MGRDAAEERLDTTTPGLRVEARDLGQRLAGQRQVLRGISLLVRPGTVTAVAGNSGTGKSVLLETLAGIRVATSGVVLHDGAPPSALRSALGFVPQEDIIHRDLPLARVLRYAARLRMPSGSPPARAAAAVDRVLDTLGLTARAAQRVATLSGGERKRASIAVELMTRPRVLFLDEPTSGLDPATGAELMVTLRMLANSGTTVVLSTHTPADLSLADQVVFLSAEGELAYAGDADALRARFGVNTWEEVYGKVAQGARPAADTPATAGTAAGAPTRSGPPEARSGTPPTPLQQPARAAELRGPGPAVEASGEGSVGPAVPAPGAGHGAAAEPPPRARAASRHTADGRPQDRPPAARPSPSGPAPVPGAWAQWVVLTRRGAEILLRNRLTLAVLLGSPLVIVAMFAVLFQPGAFDPQEPDPGSSAMILFWIAFGGFFFGLSYGLLQICTELPIVRRERLTVLRLGPYVLSKLAVLLPVLVAANVLLLAVLRLLDRLPAADWDVYGSLLVTLLLASAAALALGLLTSAAVSEPGQATLMLPMLCFPQVLFSGAFVPVPRMAWPGELLSHAMTNRWAFEALGSGIGVEELWSGGGSALGDPLLASYGDSFAGPTTVGWAVLAGVAVLLLGATWAVLAHRCRRAGAARRAAGRVTGTVSSAGVG